MSCYGGSIQILFKVTYKKGLRHTETRNLTFLIELHIGEAEEGQTEENERQAEEGQTEENERQAEEGQTEENERGAEVELAKPPRNKRLKDA